MLSCIHGAEITLPVGRFVTSCTKKSVQHHSLQDHRVTFLMQDCDWKWLSLLDTFLKHASGGSTSWSPIMQQYPVPFAVLNGRQRPPPIQLTCPPGFVSAAEVRVLIRRILSVFDMRSFATDSSHAIGCQGA